MKNRERMRERYPKDPFSIRLAGLAADLGRIASSARHPTGSASVVEMLEESRHFIKWTAAEAEPEVAAELVDIQIMLTLWLKVGPDAQHNQTQRTLLSLQAKKWSDQVLDLEVTQLKMKEGVFAGRLIVKQVRGLTASV
jgi:hypothetical protein